MAEAQTQSNLVEELTVAVNAKLGETHPAIEEGTDVMDFM